MQFIDIWKSISYIYANRVYYYINQREKSTYHLT